MQIRDYVISHTQRGECNCGKCFDKGSSPDPTSPHTVDMVFFKVAPVGEPSKEAFVKLTKQAAHGEFCDCDPLDGKEHNYLELGGWIGDQGLAMQFMGLGVALGVFKLLSPAILGLTGEQAMQMAGMGLLSVQSAA